MPYGFRLLFGTFGPSIGTDDTNLLLHTGARLCARDGGTLRTGGRLAIKGTGYPTEEAARAEGERHRLALLLAGPAAGYPVDARDAPGSASAQLVKDECLKHGVRLLDSPRGLQVFPEDDLTNRWLEMSATGTVARQSKAFVATFADTWGRIVNRDPPSEPQRAALELFNLSHADASPRAQFLTLTTVVEILTSRRRRPKDAQDFLDDCVQRLEDSPLDEEGRGRLRNGLGNLRTESISSGCRAEVERHLGAERARQFAKLYDLRGRLTHDGAAAGDLPALLENLRGLVSELLLAIFQRPAP
jgi:hypothetical protein